MFDVLAAFILANVLTAGSSSVSPPQKTLSLQLIHRCPPHIACVRSRTVDQMVRETQQIWSFLDVRIVRIDSHSGHLASANAGLTVFLEEQGAPPPLENRVVLASLVQSHIHCGAALAHVWVRNVRGFTDTVAVGGKRFDNLPNALADFILGRALGRALAHEIGHFLLGTGQHASKGLLRSTFEPYELLEAAGSARYGLKASDRQSLLACRMEKAGRSADDGQPRD